jgi:hypothetical protein
MLAPTLTRAPNALNAGDESLLDIDLHAVSSRTESSGGTMTVCVCMFCITALGKKIVIRWTAIDNFFGAV